MKKYILKSADVVGKTTTVKYFKNIDKNLSWEYTYTKSIKNSPKKEATFKCRHLFLRFLILIFSSGKPGSTPYDANCF